MRNDRMPKDATGRLMCEALHAGDYAQAARYRRICASACTACMELLTDG